MDNYAKYIEYKNKYLDLKSNQVNGQKKNIYFSTKILYDMFAPFFIVMLIASLFEYVGDSNLKFYARTDNTTNLFYGIVGYIAVIITIIYVLKYSNVMYMNVYWDALSILLETFLAYVLLGEYLDNSYQYVGIAMILIGILLLNVGKVPK